MHRVVAPRLAELCKVDGPALSAATARRLALDYRAFALMNDPPRRVRRLAERLVHEHQLPGADDKGLEEFCRALCTSLAEIYETAAAAR